MREYIKKHRKVLVILVEIGIVLIALLVVVILSTRNDKVVVKRENLSQPSTGETTAENPGQWKKAVFAEYSKDGATVHTRSLVNPALLAQAEEELPGEIGNLVYLNGAYFYLTTLGELGDWHKLVLRKNGNEQILWQTDSETVIRQFVLSPSGNKLVSLELTETYYLKQATVKIVTYDFTGSAPLRKVIYMREPSDQNIHYPIAWSKDETEVWVDTINPATGELGRGFGMINFEGNYQEILPADSYTTTPVLSPDGTRLAYVSSQNLDLIQIYDLITTASRTLTANLLDVNNILWSSTGQKLAIGGRNSVNKQAEIRVLETESGIQQAEISGFRFPLAWTDENGLIVAISSDLEYVLGGYQLNYSSIPGRGVYYYNLSNKTLTKIISDKTVQVISMQ